MKKQIRYILGMLIVIIPFLINFVPYRTKLFYGYEFYVTFFGPIIWLIGTILFVKFFKPNKFFIVFCFLLLLMAFFQMITGIILSCALFTQR